MWKTLDFVSYILEGLNMNNTMFLKKIERWHILSVERLLVTVNHTSILILESWVLSNIIQKLSQGITYTNKEIFGRKL